MAGFFYCYDALSIVLLDPSFLLVGLISWVSLSSFTQSESVSPFIDVLLSFCSVVDSLLLTWYFSAKRAAADNNIF